MNLGEKIKKLRALNKMTQVELARKSNISRSYLADIERDRYNASLDTLKSISTALGVSINEFFEAKAEPKIEKSKSYLLEQYLNILGYVIIYDSEGNVILDTPDAQYETSENDLIELQKSADSFINFKISEITNKCRKFAKIINDMPIAAHNDFEDDEKQQKLMKEDLDEL